MTPGTGTNPGVSPRCESMTDLHLVPDETLSPLEEFRHEINTEFDELGAFLAACVPMLNYVARRARTDPEAAEIQTSFDEEWRRLGGLARQRRAAAQSQNRGA